MVSLVLVELTSHYEEISFEYKASAINLLQYPIVSQSSLLPKLVQPARRASSELK